MTVERGGGRWKAFNKPKGVEKYYLSLMGGLSTVCQRETMAYIVGNTGGRIGVREGS